MCLYKWRTKITCIKNAECCPKCSKRAAVEKVKTHGQEPYKKMWETLRQKYGPTGRRKPKLSDEERLRRRKLTYERFMAKQRAIKLAQQQSFNKELSP